MAAAAAAAGLALTPSVSSSSPYSSAATNLPLTVHFPTLFSTSKTLEAATKMHSNEKVTRAVTTSPLSILLSWTSKAGGPRPGGFSCRLIVKITTIAVALVGLVSIGGFLWWIRRYICQRGFDKSATGTATSMGGDVFSMSEMKLWIHELRKDGARRDLERRGEKRIRVQERCSKGDEKRRLKGVWEDGASSHEEEVAGASTGICECAVGARA